MKQHQSYFSIDRGAQKCNIEKITTPFSHVIVFLNLC
jgi:hypothetical protein